MASLERFINPQTRVFDTNIKSLPGARLYFFDAGTTTPKTTYSDKNGTIPNTNPVIADASGSFPPIFLLGLYRVELRSNKNIVQPGWPIDNVGQDRTVVPFGEWNETFTYSEFFPVTGSNGNRYRSLINNNLGNDPVSSPSQWELVPVPVASSFTSSVDWISFSDDGDQISVDIEKDNLNDYIKTSVRVSLDGGFDAGQYIVCEKIGSTVTITSAGDLTHPNASSRLSGLVIPSEYRIGSGYTVGQSISFSFISNAGYLGAIDINQDGSIRISYFDFAGATVSRTSVGKGFSVSYTITSETP